MALSLEHQIIENYPILTGDEIAQKLKIGRYTVYYFLHKHGIKLNRPGTRNGNIPWNKGKKLNQKQKAKMKMSGLELGRAWNKGISMPKDSIEKMRNGLQAWCEQGGYSPNWKGGLSFEPYSPEFNAQLKYEIRKRDKFICQFPNCGKKENGKAHDCHHKNYNKKDSRPENLITLCFSCHMKTNGNREYWQNYFEMKEN